MYETISFCSSTNSNILLLKFSKASKESIFEDLIEYETTTLDNSTKSIDELNEIAGGSYWQSIIQEMKSGFINGYKAEERFMEEY